MHRRRLFCTPWNQVFQLWWINGHYAPFLSLVFSIDMHWRVKPFENIWKYFWNIKLNVYILSRHGLVFQKGFLKVNWLIFSVERCFVLNLHLAPVTFLILVGIGRIISNVVEARIWRCYTFQCTYLCECEAGFSVMTTKYLSRLIPKDDIRVSLSTTVPRVSDIMRRKQRQRSHWVTERLKLFVIIQKRKF